ncbi:glycosyltransferase family 2 protein [Idiomarina abyssalis]|uniref:glycosyltransferase family 2 protein n=1 Tax=Idiomarina abyssalis TaxID=86102 RepID=UPI003A8EFFBC
MSLISIVIPTFNAEKYIVDTIESVLYQTHTEFEVLVVDDCSTDSTVELVNELEGKDPRVKLIQLNHNTGGPAEPRNVGIEKATGEWIAFLDADDLWHPQKLEKQLVLAESENADFICSKLVDFRGELTLNEIKSSELGNEDISPLNFNNLIVKNRVGTSSVLVRAKLIKNFRFDTARKYVAVEDYKLWLELSSTKSKMVKSSLPLVRYRILSSSISRNKSKQIKKVLRVVWETCESHSFSRKLMYPIYVLTYASESIRLRLFKKEL